MSGIMEFRSQELSFPDESSRYGTFVPGNENTMELSFPGAKVTWNFRSRERKSHGTFVLGNESDVELSLSVINC